MRKIFTIFFGIFFLFLFLKPQSTSAAVTLDHKDPDHILKNTSEVKFTFKSDNNDFKEKQTWTFVTTHLNSKGESDDRTLKNTKTNGQIIDSSTLEVKWGNYSVEGRWKYELFVRNDFRTVITSGEFTVFPPGDVNTGIPAIAMEHSIFKARSQAKVYILNAIPGKLYRLWFDGDIIPLATEKADNLIPIDLGNDIKSDKTKVISIDMGSASAKNLCMNYQDSFLGFTTITLSCDFRLKGIVVTNLEPSAPGDPIASNKTGFPKDAESVTKEGPCGSGFCKTAVGNISTDPAGFVKDIFGRVLSLAGGVAIILIIISGYRLMASGGNPEKVQHAREQLTSAIVGLLFIIFSLSILQIIGVDILHIPGLTK